VFNFSELDILKRQLKPFFQLYTLLIEITEFDETL